MYTYIYIYIYIQARLVRRLDAGARENRVGGVAAARGVPHI